MSDHIDASTQHGAGDSPDTTAPTKHSLRASEPASSGRSTREEDLANGPLLLALGDGLEEPVVSHPEICLTSQYSDNHRPEESILPSIPLRLSGALVAGPMTSSTISQSGASLSTPTESSSSAVQSLPVGPTESSVVRDRDFFLFAQPYEFSWQESGLCFGGEPLRVTRTSDDKFSKVDPGSERALSEPHKFATESTIQDVPAAMLISFNMADMGEFMEHSSPTMLIEDLELASTTSSVVISASSPSETMDSNTTTEPSDPNQVVAMHRYADWIVELLIDDLYRSRGPQASNRRIAGASKKVTEGASNNPEGGKKGFNGKARVESKSQKRKALGGDGESEDEGSQDKKRKSSDIGKDNKRYRWVCPFVKWKPDEYACKVGPIHFRSIKDHVKNVHWKEYCDRCWSIYAESTDAAAHGICREIPPRSDPPPGLITYEMGHEIFTKRADGSVSHEEQWHRLYSVLFPGEQRWHSPYVNNETGDFMDKAEDWFRSKKCRDILEEEISKLEFKETEQKQVANLVWDKVFPRMFQEQAINGERFRKLVSNGPKATANAQSNQVANAGTSKAIPEPDPQYHTSTPSPGETFISYQFPEMESGEIPTFDLQTPAGETILGDDTFSGLLNLTGFEGPPDGVDPRELEGCSQDMLGSLLPDNFENALYENLDTDENYLAFTAGIY
ncbi:hypothetical protein FG05_10340 [Fusarium graminearum]|nr:hypothetical protein FG05_10340 [Fusarium graminearum]